MVCPFSTQPGIHLDFWGIFADLAPFRGTNNSGSAATKQTRKRRRQNLNQANPDGQINTWLDGDIFEIEIDRPATLTGFTPKMMRESTSLELTNNSYDACEVGAGGRGRTGTALSSRGIFVPATAFAASPSRVRALARLWSGLYLHRSASAL